MGAKEPNCFADRLVRLRNIERLTQTKLAKRLNMSRSCLANYEGGRRYPDPQTLIIIAKYFRVSVGYLTGEVDTSSEMMGTAGKFVQTAKAAMPDGWLDIGNLSLVQRKSILDYLEYLKANEKGSGKQYPSNIVSYIAYFFNAKRL